MTVISNVRIIIEGNSGTVGEGEGLGDWVDVGEVGEGLGKRFDVDMGVGVGMNVEFGLSIEKYMVLMYDLY